MNTITEAGAANAAWPVCALAPTPTLDTPPSDQSGPNPVEALDNYQPGGGRGTGKPNWLIDRTAQAGRAAKKPKGLRVKNLKRSDMARPASQINRKDLVRLFGSDGPRLADMAKAHPDITIGHLMQLKRADSSQITQATELLSQRPDLGLNDLMDEVGNGNALLKPATYDVTSRDMLGKRSGLRPDELATMGDQFRHSYGSEAGRAYGKAADLLSYRGDLSAESLESQARGLPHGAVSDQENYQRFEDHHGDHNYSRVVFDLIA